MSSVGRRRLGPSEMREHMDVRTIAAFVLVGLILLLLPRYQTWLVKDKDREQVRKQEAVRDSAGVAERSMERGAGEPLRIPARDAAAQRGDLQEPEADQKGRKTWRTSEAEQGAQELGIRKERRGFVAEEISVENEVFLIRISTEGGVVTGCRLKRFTGPKEDLDPKENLASLLPKDGRGLGMVEIKRMGLEDLSRLEFAPVGRKYFKEPLWVGEEGLELVLACDLGDGRRIEKQFVFGEDRYDFEVKVRMVGFEPGQRLGLRWKGGLGRTEVNVRDELGHAKVYTMMGGEVESLDASSKDEPSEKSLFGQLGWAGFKNKYFLMAIAPTDSRACEVDLSGTFLEDVDKERSRKVYNLSLASEVGYEGMWENLIYLGPLDYEGLKRYGIGLEEAVDLGWVGFRPISKVLLYLLVAMHKVVPNYGVVIILFATLVKVAFYPLTHKTYEASAGMQKLQPKMAEIKERYKSDQQRMSREMMKLYKESGMNPLKGCFPLLLQMPIFFALYRVFANTIELRKAGFALWIDDLSQPDRLPLPFPLPYVGNELHVLPLLMAASMFIQQRMTVQDPRQKMMVYLMPVMMLFFFWGISSGLVLYWTVFNILSAIQQMVLMKKKGGAPAPVPSKGAGEAKGWSTGQFLSKRR